MQPTRQQLGIRSLAGVLGMLILIGLPAWVDASNGRSSRPEADRPEAGRVEAGRVEAGRLDGSRVDGSQLEVASSALAPAHPAQAGEPVRATLYTGVVRWRTTPGRAVTVTIRSGAEVKAVSSTISDPFGEVVVFLAGRDVVEPGDVIEIEAAGEPGVPHPVPELHADLSADESELLIDGPAARPISAAFYDASGTQVALMTSQIDSNGELVLSLPEGLTVEPDVYGEVTVTTETGDEFTARWDVFFVGVQVGLPFLFGAGTLGRRVTGSAHTDSRHLTARPSEIRGEPEWSLAFRDGPRVALSAGDVVTATIEGGPTLSSTVSSTGSVTVSGTVPHLTASMDGQLDRVVGEGPPSTELVVSAEVGGSTVDVTVTTDPTGAYVADFAGLGDLTDDTRVFTVLFDGRISYWARAAETTNVHAQLAGPVVFGAAEPGANIDATLTDAAGSLRGRGADRANPNGDFMLVLPVAAQPGDQLEVEADAEIIAQLTYPDLAVTADIDADRLSFQGPPSTTLTFRAFEAADQVHTVMTSTGTTGGVALDLAAEVDLTSGSFGDASVLVDGDHSVFLYWSIPKADLVLDDHEMFVSAVQDSEVGVDLRRDDTVVGQLTVTLDGPIRDEEPRLVRQRGQLEGPGGAPAPVQAGDRVVVASPELTQTLVVPPILLNVTPETDTVSGSTLANAPVAVTVGEGSGQTTIETVAGSDGEFATDFSGQADIRAWDAVWATATITHGHTVARRVTLPGLRAYLEEGRVEGRAGPSASVMLQLRDELGNIRARGDAVAGAGGLFASDLRDNAGERVDPEAGDTLIAQWDGTVVAMFIPTLTVEIDTDDNAVFGTADAGSEISILARGTRGERLVLTTQADAEGSYRIPVPRRLELEPGASVAVTLTTAAGHEAVIVRHLTGLAVHNGGNQVSARVSAGAPVTVTLMRDDLVVRASAQADAFGSVTAQLSNAGEPFKILTGDQIELTSPGSPPIRSEMTVAPITAAVDHETGLVTGQTTATTTVTVVAPGVDQPQRLEVTSDAMGAYTASLAADALTAGTAVEAHVTDPHGARTYALAVVAYLETTLGQRTIRGRAAPIVPVGLSLVRDADPVAGAFSRTDGAGWFTATLGAPAEAGLTLRLGQPGGRSTELLLPDMTANLDRGGGRVWGTAPAGAELEVVLEPPTDEPVAVSVSADAEGNWEVLNRDLPTGYPFSIADMLSAAAHLRVPPGHLVIAVAPESVTPTPTSGPTTVTPTTTSTAGTPTPGTGTPSTATPGTDTPGTPGTGTPGTRVPGAYRILAPWVAQR